MKIIDLLNKISNDEEIPKKFIWDDKKYYLQSDKCYKCDETSTILEEDFIVENLNDEIEIIEEKKMPEKLDDTELYLTENQQHLIVNKINEIINYLDYLKSKGE